MGKTDSTGSYSYVCDGASAGSPVLNDGHATFTPGLSENRGGVSSYGAYDLLGNLWFQDNGSGQQTFYQDTSGFGFGAGYGIGGSNPSGFGYGGENGCQSDADTGLVLMGHRYYDSRIGRFISQDPAGDGDNWYAYAGNNPTNEIDPSGLESLSKTDLFWMMYTSGNYSGGDYKYSSSGGIQWTGADGTGYQIGSHVVEIPSGNGSSFGNGMGGGLNMGAGGMLRPGPDGKSNFEYHMREQPDPDMHIYPDGNPKGDEININHEGKLRTGLHKGRELLKQIPKKLKSAYRPIIKTFLQRAGMAADAIEAALDDLTLDIPIIYFDPKQADMYAHPQGGA